MRRVIEQMGRRSGIAPALVAALLLIAGCSSEAIPTTTTEGAATTSTVVETTAATTTTAPSTTTVPTSTTTTTLVPTPDALPIVEDGWDWVELLPVAGATNVRYDGTYLVYSQLPGALVVAMRDGEVILEHTKPDDRDWIVQDVELGDHWLGVVDNTETDPLTSRVVVYDLVTGETVLQEVIGGGSGPFGYPSIAMSGRYLAMNDGLPESGCVDVYDLGIIDAIGEPGQLGQICQDDPVWSIQIDGGYVAFGSRSDECTTAWTGEVYGGGEHHGLTAHTNRPCWSNSPAASGPITLWFESIPGGSRGNDTLLGENRAGETVSLGRGLRGTAEACWGRAVWVGGNSYVRFWDGGNTVRTVFSAASPYIDVGCVGPWATVATSDGLYAANMLTGSATGSCSLVERADETRVADLETALLDWVHTNYEDVPADVTASVGAVGLDGWWMGAGSFSDYLESAVFVWYPDGSIRVAWAGSADSVSDIRQYMFSVLPEAPPSLLGCVAVAGFAQS